MWATAPTVGNLFRPGIESKLASEWPSMCICTHDYEREKQKREEEAI